MQHTIAQHLLEAETTTRSLLLTRYSSKAFDKTDKQISKEQLQNLYDVVNLCPSSFNMQPYVVFDFDEQMLKEHTNLVYGQQQYNAKRMFVVCSKSNDYNYDEYDQERIDAWKRTIEQRKTSVIQEKWKDDAATSMSDEWSAQQAYLLAVPVTMTAGELGISSCIMEGVNHGQLHAALKKQFADTYKREDCNTLFTEYVIMFGFNNSSLTTVNNEKKRSNVMLTK